MSCEQLQISTNVRLIRTVIQWGSWCGSKVGALNSSLLFLDVGYGWDLRLTKTFKQDCTSEILNVWTLLWRHILDKEDGWFEGDIHANRGEGLQSTSRATFDVFVQKKTAQLYLPINSKDEQTKKRIREPKKCADDKRLSKERKTCDSPICLPKKKKMRKSFI